MPNRWNDEPTLLREALTALAVASALTLLGVALLFWVWGWL